MDTSKRKVIIFKYSRTLKTWPFGCGFLFLNNPIKIILIEDIIQIRFYDFWTYEIANFKNIIFTNIIQFKVPIKQIVTPYYKYVCHIISKIEYQVNTVTIRIGFKTQIPWVSMEKMWNLTGYVK